MHLFLQPVFNCQGTLPVAKTNAELNAFSAHCAHSSSRGFASPFSCCGPCITGGWGTLFRLNRWRRLVELIGIEPTTPCLQSRCSPI